MPDDVQEKPERNDEQFGNTIAGSRWFKGEPQITRRVMRPVQERWLCPHDGCDGEMLSSGWNWPTNPPGYHHTCTVCGFTAAPMSGQHFPRITYEEDPNAR